MAIPDEPLTRNEHYLARITGQDVEIPDPITREDHYLDYIARNGSGGTAASTTYDNSESGLAAENVQDAIDELAKAKPTIETTLPATVATNTIYKLNTAGATSDAITTVLPDGTTVGDVIVILWDNGATPATVTITGTLYPFSFTPSANKHTELNAFWDGEAWSLVTNEQEMSSGE